jgi:hypothetical protein
MWLSQVLYYVIKLVWLAIMTRLSHCMTMSSIFDVLKLMWLQLLYVNWKLIEFCWKQYTSCQTTNKGYIFFLRFGIQLRSKERNHLHSFGLDLMWIFQVWFVEFLWLFYLFNVYLINTHCIHIVLVQPFVSCLVSCVNQITTRHISLSSDVVLPIWRDMI